MLFVGSMQEITGTAALSVLVMIKHLVLEEGGLNAHHSFQDVRKGELKESNHGLATNRTCY